MGKRNEMTPELWQAKKIVDSTLHPGALLPASRAIPFRNMCGVGGIECRGGEVGFAQEKKKYNISR